MENGTMPGGKADRRLASKGREPVGLSFLKTPEGGGGCASQSGTAEGCIIQKGLLPEAMLGRLGLVFYCSLMQHLGGGDCPGEGGFESQQEVSNIKHGPPVAALIG